MDSQLVVVWLAMVLVLLLLLLLLPWYCMARPRGYTRQEHYNTVAHAAHVNNNITTLMSLGV